MSDDTFGTLRPFDLLSPRGLAGKREYVLDLERRGDAEAVSLLVECLVDESGYLRDLAGAALVRLRAAAGPILPLLSHGLWFTRVSAARTLGRLGAREASRPLAGLLDDLNHSVVSEAVLAMVAIARSGGAVAVARALHTHPADVRDRAVRAARIGDPEAAEKLALLLADRDLMLAGDDELLVHDAPLVAADEVAWEVLTSDAVTR